MRFFSYLVTLLLATLLASCGGGGGSPGVIIGPQALAVDAPSGLTILIGTARAFSITGGKAPYSATSNNELVAVTGVEGGTLFIGTVGIGTATITVRDAFGATVTVPLTSAQAHPLGTSAPSSITLEMGASQTFSVSGGAPGYSARSANTNIASASIIGGSLRITGVTPGTTSVLVTDGIGNTVSIQVTVTPVGNLALFTTAPASLTQAINTTSTFSVGGGVPFGSAPAYQVSSSNNSVATATLSGNTLTIHTAAVGSANITIRDSVNATTVVSVTVPSPGNVFTTAPSAVTIGIGSSPVYDVGGGLAPYTVATSNAAVATASLNGTVLTINGIGAGTASIIVRDSLGSTTTIGVTVPAANTPTPTALFTTAPASITMPASTSQTFAVSGGTGTYFLTSNNTSVATVSPATSSGPMTITGVSAGTAQIQIKDTTGSSVLTVGVTVTAAGTVVPLSTTAPSSVVVALNTTSDYSVSGGTAPYSVSSSNPSVLTGSIVSGSVLRLTGVTAGSATVTVFDSAGASKQISATVTQPGAVLQLLPAAFSISETYAGNIVLNIFGGTGPYTALTSDLVRAPVSVAGNQVTVTLSNKCVATNTAVTITVIDSLGASSTSTMTIADNGGACP
ncbi:MAG: hypothetical protein V4864_11930 [Pseudomonadota bacterium]